MEVAWMSFAIEQHGRGGKQHQHDQDKQLLYFLATAITKRAEKRVGDSQHLKRELVV
jgi:hypothetical protein